MALHWCSSVEGSGNTEVNSNLCPSVEGSRHPWNVGFAPRKAVLDDNLGAMAIEELRGAVEQLRLDVLVLKAQPRAGSDLETRVALLEGKSSLPKGIGKACADIMVDRDNVSLGDEYFEEPANEARVSQMTAHEDLWIRESTHSIAESVWECAILAWIPGVGSVGSCMLMISLVLNATMQLIFCFVATTSTTFYEESFPPEAVDSARRWRLTEAHHADWVDKSSWVSLARRVCDKDKAVIFATGQMQTLESIEGYIGGPDERMYVGPLLCGVVLVTWFLHLAKELQSLFDFTRAVWALPRQESKLVTSRDGKFFLKSISCARLGFLAAVALIRLGIAIMLGLAGLLWLANTSAVAELVLNAASLAFVMDIDELIFRTITPVVMRDIVRCLEPLHRPVGWRFKGINAHSVIILLGCILCTGYFMNGYVIVMTSRMAEVQRELCNGNLDFIVDQNVDLGYGVVAATLQPSESSAALPDTLLKHVSAEFVERRLDELQTEQGSHKWSAVYSNSRASFISEMALDVRTMPNAPVCWDLMGGVPGGSGDPNRYTGAFRSALRFLTSNHSSSSCVDFSWHCAARPNKLLRFACSKTCGCSQPRSGLLFVDGCPSTCDTENQDGLSFLPCEDLPARHFNNSLNLQRFLRTFDVFVREEGIGALPYEAIMQHGCDSLTDETQTLGFVQNSSWMQLVLCGQSGFETASIRPFCPVSCKCISQPSCPKTCGGAAPPNASGCRGGLCLGRVIQPNILVSDKDSNHTCLSMDTSFNGFFNDAECTEIRMLRKDVCCSDY